MTSYINAEHKVFKELLESDISGPIQMLNLLKFKEGGGALRYKSYMLAAKSFFDRSGAKTIYFGSVSINLIGPQNQEWDKVLIIEYPNKEALIEMVLDKNYPAPLREAALIDSRLILCQ